MGPRMPLMDAEYALDIYFERRIIRWMNKGADYRSWLVSPLHKALRQVTAHVEERADDMAGSDGHLLAYVQRYGPCAVGALREVFGLPPSTLTSVLNRLEDGGYIRRELNAEDRRSLLVRATRKGRGFVARAGRTLEEFERGVRDRVPPDAIEGFIEVLRTIEDQFEAKKKRRTDDESDGRVSR